MGFVYFFKHNGIDGVKIGMTNNSESVDDRFNSFKTYSPTGAKVCGVIETDSPAMLENELHKKYTTVRMNGEFFNIGELEINSEINKRDKDLRFINKFTALSNVQKDYLISYVNRANSKINDVKKGTKNYPFKDEIMGVIDLYLLQTNSDYVMVTPTDIKKHFFLKNNKITTIIIRNILKNCYTYEISKMIRYTPMDIPGAATYGRPLKIFRNI